MLPFFTEEFANPGSVNHVFGRSIAEVVFEEQRATASFIHAVPEELVFTSGATESNNLALFGVCLHPRQKRRRVLTVATEHRSILDPLKKLERHGFEVIECPVMPLGHAQAGRVDLDRFANLLDEHIALVTVMLANNEIGVIQDLATIASICRTCDVWLHTDATQALGKLPIDVDAFDVDLMSFSAHKFYGPKGVGGLFVRNRQRMVRLDPQMVGGGHQWNRRSGTLNVPGIVGMSCALSICEREREVEGTKVRGLRNRFVERTAERAVRCCVEWAEARGRFPASWQQSQLPVSGGRRTGPDVADTEPLLQQWKRLHIVSSRAEPCLARDRMQRR